MDRVITDTTDVRSKLMQVGLIRTQQATDALVALSLAYQKGDDERLFERYQQAEAAAKQSIMARKASHRVAARRMLGDNLDAINSYYGVDDNHMLMTPDVLKLINALAAIDAVAHTLQGIDEIEAR